MILGIVTDMGDIHGLHSRMQPLKISRWRGLQPRSTDGQRLTCEKIYKAGERLPEYRSPFITITTVIRSIWETGKGLLSDVGPWTRNCASVTWRLHRTSGRSLTRLNASSASLRQNAELSKPCGHRVRLSKMPDGSMCIMLTASEP